MVAILLINFTISYLLKCPTKLTFDFIKRELSEKHNIGEIGPSKLKL